MTAPHPAWYHTLTRRHWQTLAAAQLGWMLDGMDVMLYAFALTSIQHEFGLSAATAGLLASATLLTSAVGGIVAGILADRYGRARILAYSILIYSIFTGATATANSIGALVFWRSLVGFGLGAEWSAGSVLVAETWPAEHRGKAIGLMQSGWAIGYILAALLAGAILPRFGWRPLFLAGVLPALLAVWVRRAIPEPEVWSKSKRDDRVAMHFGSMFRPPLLRNTLLATGLATSLLCAYWGLFTWMPTYLSSPAAKGGAGLGIVKSSTWIIPMQVGAFFGYTLFGILADRFGRRPVLLFFLVAAAALVPLYTLAGKSPTTLLLLGPLIGFFGHGYFSVFGSLLAELFPSAIRATAQGFCYNSGRAVSALAPFLIGAIADAVGFGAALACTSALYLTGGALVLFLPETKGGALQ